MKIPTFSIGSTSSNGGLLSNCLIFLPLKNSSRDKNLMAPQQWLANQDSTSEQKYDLQQVPPGGSTKLQTKRWKRRNCNKNGWKHIFPSLRIHETDGGIFTYMDVSLKKAAKWHILTIGSMYGIFRYLHENHKNQPNLGIWIYHTWKR